MVEMVAVTMRKGRCVFSWMAIPRGEGRGSDGHQRPFERGKTPGKSVSPN